MKSLFILLTLLIASGSSQYVVDLKQVRCLVCRTIIDEFLYEVSKIDPARKIEIGQYRLDPKGNTVLKKMPLATSHIHLSEIFESFCKKMQDYVRATYKSNGKLTLLKLSDDGSKSLMKDVDIVQDGDLNKSLEYYCEEIINEYDDDIIDIVSKMENNVKNKVCTQISNSCEEEVDDEDEIKHSDDEEIDYDKIEL